MKTMSDTDIPRSIRFPKELWEAIDNDAKRCKRSAVKQLEAVLSYYYELDNVELDINKLKAVRYANSSRVGMTHKESEAFLQEKFGKNKLRSAEGAKEKDRAHLSSPDKNAQQLGEIGFDYPGLSKKGRGKKKHEDELLDAQIKKIQQDEDKYGAKQ